MRNPCKNGAKCVNSVGGYSCQCPANFKGKHCDEGIRKSGVYWQCGVSSYWEAISMRKKTTVCFSAPYIKKQRENPAPFANYLASTKISIVEVG